MIGINVQESFLVFVSNVSEVNSLYNRNKNRRITAEHNTEKILHVTTGLCHVHT